MDDSIVHKRRNLDNGLLKVSTIINFDQRDSRKTKKDEKIQDIL